LAKKTKDILLFTTIENCKILQESNFWLGDGTFKVCPKLFYQVYVLHALIKKGTQETFVPLVFALMTGKNQELYTQMFSLINEYCIENNLNVTTNTNLEIVTDFGKAAINSINETFPFAIHSTCFFHFSQNIYRKIQEFGLSSKYANDVEFNLLARHLPAMAFLPVSMVCISNR